jgi:Lon protease-like protein
MRSLPLFPLSAVLLPGGRMPLKIFEQRYLDLVRESMKSGEPFGVVWIRRGAEISGPGQAPLDLGDFGTCARIVDWDQLPNGLLGITVEGSERFELFDTSVRDNGLVIGEVAIQEAALAEPMAGEWAALAEVLRSLQTHPHVQRLNLSIDHDNAWSVGYSLLQLLPIEENIKYELLALETVEALMGELDALLNQISG